MNDLYDSAAEQRPPSGVPDGPYAVTPDMLAAVSDPAAAARMIALSWAITAWVKPGTGASDYTGKVLASEAERWATWIMNGGEKRGHRSHLGACQGGCGRVAEKQGGYCCKPCFHCKSVHSESCDERDAEQRED